MTAAAKAPRIFWDADDNEKLSNALWEMGVHSPKHPNILNLVREQQHLVLAPDRIRSHLVGINHIRKFIEYFGDFTKRKGKPSVRIVPRSKPTVTGVDIDSVHTEPTLVKTPVAAFTPAKEPEPSVPQPSVPQAVVPPAPAASIANEIVALAQELPASADLILETLAGQLAERFVRHLRRALHDVADREVALFLQGTAPPLEASTPAPVAAPIAPPATQFHAESSVGMRAEAEMVDHARYSASPDDAPRYEPLPHAVPHDAPDHLAHLDPPPPPEVVPNAHPFRQERQHEAARATLSVQPRAKKKVAILGLPPGQMSHISVETRRKLDIKIIDQTASQSDLQHRIANCDVVIGAWGIGKVARGVARLHPNFILIEGGLTQLKKQLDAMV